MIFFRVKKFGNIGSGKTTLGKAIQEISGFKFIQIDEIREKYLKGKVSQEYYCLHEFIQAIETNNDLIMEFTGVGCHKFAVKRALELSNDKIMIILCQTRNFDLILDHIGKKKFGYVSPFYSKIENHSQFIKQEIHDDLINNFWKSLDFEFREVYMDNSDDLKIKRELIKEILF